MADRSRSRRWAVGAAVLGLALAAGCARPPETETERVAIGVILPLSGPESRTGEEILTGMELAVEATQKAPPAELRVADGKGEPTHSVHAFGDLVAREGTAVVIGGWFASTARTLAAVSRASDAPLVSLSPLTRGRSDTPPLALHRLDALGAAAAVFAREDLGASTAGVVRRDGSEVSDAVASAFADAFRSTVNGDAGEVLWTAVLREEGKADWPSGPEPAIDVLFVAGTGRNARQAAGHSAKTRRAALLTVEGWDPEGLEALAADGASVYQVSFYSDTDPSAPNGRLMAACERIGREPTPAIAAGWDAVRMIRHAASRSGVKRAELAAALRSGASFNGATGRIEFSASGEVRETPAVSSLSSGGPVFLRRVEAALVPGVDAPNR